MFILCMVKDEERPKQRRGRPPKNAKPKTDGTAMIRDRVALAVDNRNLLIAHTTGETFMGKKFSPRFEWLFRSLPEFGVDVEHARKQLRDAFARVYDRTDLPEDMTVAQMDAEFRPGKYGQNSAGILELYTFLREKFGYDGESEDED